MFNYVYKSRHQILLKSNPGYIPRKYFKKNKVCDKGHVFQLFTPFTTPYKGIELYNKPICTILSFRMGQRQRCYFLKLVFTMKRGTNTPKVVGPTNSAIDEK